MLSRRAEQHNEKILIMAHVKRYGIFIFETLCADRRTPGARLTFPVYSPKCIMGNDFKAPNRTPRLILLC